MSHDLEVYGVEALGAAALDSIFPDHKVIAEVSSTHISVTRTVRGKAQYAFGIDGPLRIEKEDLPPVVAEQSVGVSVLYQVSVPASSQASLGLAKRSARAMAELTRGVLYDPQEDRIVWPRGGTRRFAPTKEERVDVLKFIWHVSRQGMARNLAEVVFDTIAATLPEALPRRFGDYEPLQHRLDVAGREGFIKFWQDEQMSMFWKSRRPCFGGYVSNLGDRPLGKLNPTASVSLEFDCRVTEDPRWCEDLINLFVQIAENVRAFYAHAVVERGWMLRGSSLSIEAGRLDQFPPGLVGREGWLGLPPYPIWLGWYGRHYADMVRSHFESDDVVRVGDALFRRASQFPLDAESAPLPPELLMKVLDYKTRRARSACPRAFDRLAGAAPAKLPRLRA